MRGDLEWGTIPKLMLRAAEEDGSRPAIIDTEAIQTLSFAELAERSLRAAGGFVAMGIQRGDRVAVWAPNMWEWVVAALGLQAAGAALVPLNTRYKGREAAYILSRSGAKALVTVRGFLGADYPAMLDGHDIPTLRHTILMRGLPEPGEMTFSDLCAVGTMDQARARVREVQPEDPSDILFTSGTTGNPKGVVCTHAQSLRTFTEWTAVVGLEARDRYLVVNPFFHAFGYKAGWLSGLIRRCTIYPHPVFDPAAVLKRIPRDRISMLPGPPTLFQKLLLDPALPRVDLSSLRLAVTGAAVIPTSLIREMRTTLGFETVITGYGLTEACGVATMCRFDDDAETIARTSGRAIEGTEVQVVDDHGVEVPRGEPGEVVVRGYNVMTHYFDDPAATAASVTSDGWLKTGDIGVMDPRGYLRITDRKKDMFIVGGFNAYPAEIENILLDHPEVAQVAVVGAPHPKMGEVGVAYVVPMPGKAPTREAIIAWSREQMANYKVPRRVELVDTLPTNALGKVTRYVLKELASQ